MINYYPPAGFHFAVQFLNPQFAVIDSMFQSVAGLSVEMETMEVVEGGENRFKHKLPVSARYPNLVLKRGMIPDSTLLRWCRNATENFEFLPMDLVVTLLGPAMVPLKVWSIKGAYPVKWEVSELNAMESKIVVETLELTYQYFTNPSEQLF
jgi:phage tail-like protein